MLQPLPVLVNRSGGTARALGEALVPAVVAAFAQTGHTISLELLDASDMDEAVRRHVGAPIVAIGGGDGTLASAAAVLANSPSALAILPLGTRNHLARQLNVPMNLIEAAHLTVEGQRRRIDLGSAGGRVFVNNASFGLYTRFVRERDRGAWSRWSGSVRAAWHVLWNMRAQGFPMRVDARVSVVATPLLFIGNNQYSLTPGQLGERESLSEHQLSVFAVAAKRPLELVGLALRAVLGITRPEIDFLECGKAREVVIEGSGTIEGTFDGELATLPLPLRVLALPNALGVVTPRESAQAERALSPAH